MNGDGAPDLVLVSTDGKIVVRLAGGGQLTAYVGADESLRLQALPGLFGTSRRDIVVASSTAGCCDSYQLLGSRAVVLEEWHGQLRLLHGPSGRPFLLSFNDAVGRGWPSVTVGIRPGIGLRGLLSVAALLVCGRSRGPRRWLR